MGQKSNKHDLALVSEVEKIKELSGIKDSQGFLTEEELRAKVPATINSNAVCYLRVKKCPCCQLFYYGYINELCVGTKYDSTDGLKECDACAHLDKVYKNQIKKLWANRQVN